MRQMSAQLRRSMWRTGSPMVDQVDHSSESVRRRDRGVVGRVKKWSAADVGITFMFQVWDGEVRRAETNSGIFIDATLPVAPMIK
jgi:hypothetical protein